MDVQGGFDVIEEVARAYGYERIPAVLPTAVIGIEAQDNAQKLFSGSLLKELKESFLKSGFTEVINYSFMGEQDLDFLGFDTDDERREWYGKRTFCVLKMPACAQHLFLP